ncbi:MAG: hypothetical protein DHS20C18_30550 [Saprospiraceae bacterium]|nr:MAG: hypothetical protein DHS20C18_30550 [Saprospiraceae bacterium]
MYGRSGKVSPDTIQHNFVPLARYRMLAEQGLSNKQKQQTNDSGKFYFHEIVTSLVPKNIEIIRKSKLINTFRLLLK